MDRCLDWRHQPIPKEDGVSISASMGVMSAASYQAAAEKTGQTVVIQGVMVPGKNLKALVPLQVTHMK